MMAAIFNLAILESAIFVFTLELAHTCQDWFPPFPKKKQKTSLTLHSSPFAQNILLIQSD